jgi:hypothetical protein
MKDKKTYKWSPPKWLINPVEKEVLFHDKEVETYSGFVEVKEIKLWRDNNRTTLDLEHLLQELGKKKIRNLSDDEIVDYILEQGLHKIQELAGSIKKNGVRVPLTLSYKKELLDGNRRFLACKYLIAHEKVINENFTKVPVYCLKPDIDKELRLKIIAEMNFLPDHKEPWTREVRAKFAVEQFDKFFIEFKDEEKAYNQVDYLLDVNKQDLKRFKSVLGMINEYINYVEKDTAQTKQSAERFARAKFHFFEEFYNKTCLGNTPIRDNKILRKSKQLLYKYLLNQQINSLTKIRELAEIVRYDPARSHLEKPNGNFELARAIYQDYSRPKKAGPKILHFCEWLENLSKNERAEISGELKKRLLSAVTRLRDE